MQTQLMTLPGHELNGNIIMCRETTGSFGIAVWNKLPYGVCPCCKQPVSERIIKEVKSKRQNFGR